MREERRNYLVVGAFVLAVLAGLVVALAQLAGRTGATDSYHVVYDSVMGVSSGTQVLYEGYVIGIVDDIEPLLVDGRRRFRVDLAVRRGWAIPADSEAVVTAPGFLAAVVIDIRGGRSETLLAPESEIRAGAAASVVTAVSTVAGEISDLMENRIEPILDSLADGAPEIVGNLREFSGDLNETGSRLSSALGHANMERVDSILVNLETASTDLSRFAGELGTTREEIDRLLARANALLDEDRGKLDHAITDLHDSLEAVASHSDAIAHDLEATSRNLAEFSRQLRENPAVLLRGRSGSDEAEPY